MATPNVGILTNAGKDLIDRVNASQTKITFTKIVFSSMDNSQLTDDKIRALTTVTPQEVVVNNPEVTLDNSTGETRIRATGTNEKLDDGVYVKTYGVFAKDDTGNEILYGLTVSPNPNYFPAYDGVTPQVVTYSYKVIISNTSNITFTNSNDIYLSETDLGESLKPYAKTVYVNQQLDKVVHKTGTEEIAGQKTFDIAPIDRTTGNPYITKDGVPNVDLSGYVIDNKNNTIKANNVNYDLSKSDLTSLTYYGSGSFNNLPLGTVLADASSMTDGPSSSTFITTTFYSSQFGGNKAQIAINNGANRIYFRTGSPAWNNWMLVPNDSNLVHNSNDETIWGQKTFDTAPIDKTSGNPYITKSDIPSIPSDIARTGQSQTFTAAQTFSSAPTVLDTSSSKGDNQVALMGDLKSVENSAWRMMTGSSDFFSNYTCLFRVNTSQKRIEIWLRGKPSGANSGTVIDLSNIINGISKIDGYLTMFVQGGGVWETVPSISGNKLITNQSESPDYNLGAILDHSALGTENGEDCLPFYVYYNALK